MMIVATWCDYAAAAAAAADDDDDGDDDDYDDDDDDIWGLYAGGFGKYLRH